SARRVCHGLCIHLTLPASPTRRSSDLGRHRALQGLQYADRADQHQHLLSQSESRRRELSASLPFVGTRSHLDPFDRAREPVLFEDRKSTRLNSSHVKISYAVFCLKKKN